MRAARSPALPPAGEDRGHRGRRHRAVDAVADEQQGPRVVHHRDPDVLGPDGPRARGDDVLQARVRGQPQGPHVRGERVVAGQRAQGAPVPRQRAAVAHPRQAPSRLARPGGEGDDRGGVAGDEVLRGLQQVVDGEQRGVGPALEGGDAHRVVGHEARGEPGVLGVADPVGDRDGETTPRRAVRGDGVGLVPPGTAVGRVPDEDVGAGEVVPAATVPGGTVTAAVMDGPSSPVVGAGVSGAYRPGWAGSLGAACAPDEDRGWGRALACLWRNAEIL